MAKTGKIKLYGTIRSWSENSAAEFTQRFTQASAGCDSLELHLHCYGGECFEGNLIYNLIRSSKIPVDIYVDGIAASMGSIIMLAARKVFMSDNAFVMIHAPKSWVDGTADDFTKAAKLLASLEKTFVKVYQSRTGKTEAEIRQWLIGDNWFSAQDAVDAKLVDGIVDAISPADLTDIMSRESATPPADMLYARYTDLVTTETQNNQSNQSNLKKTMDKKSLIAKFSLQGVTEQSTDAEIETAIEAKLNAEKTARVNAENVIAEGKKNRIAAMIASAKLSGKIDAKNEKTFEVIGETSGEEALATALDSIKTIPTITGQLNGGSGNAGTSNRADWDFDRWQKEDPRGLEKLSYDDMNALYKAKFGSDCPK